MSTDLAVVVPHTGEVLDLPNESEQHLGELLSEVKVLESQLRELRAQVSDELHRRFDRARRWSVTTPGGIKLSGKSDAPVVSWDAEPLYWALKALVNENVIEQEAMDRAVSMTYDYEPHVVGLNALMKSEAIATRIGVYRSERPVEGRRVSVSHG